MDVFLYLRDIHTEHGLEKSLSGIHLEVPFEHTNSIHLEHKKIILDISNVWLLWVVVIIDDLSASGVNQTVQTAESPKPHSADFIAAMLLAVLKVSEGSKLMGRSFDLKSAYKQLAIAKESLSFAFVAVYNPERAKAEIFQLLAAPFGATRSVYSFLRLSNAIWYIGVKALNLIWELFLRRLRGLQQRRTCEQH